MEHNNTNERPTKRTKTESDAGKLSCGQDSAVSSTASEEHRAEPVSSSPVASSPPALPCYWDSTEARKLFQPTNDEANALEAINNQLKIFMEANKGPQTSLVAVEDVVAADLNER